MLIDNQFQFDQQYFEYIIENNVIHFEEDNQSNIVF